MSMYWQHESPLRCLQDHEMLWLGAVYWICPCCHRIYVESNS